MTSLISLRLDAGQKQTHNLDITFSDDGVKAVVQATVQLEHAEYGIDINCIFDCDIELVCSRCIETFKKELVIEHHIIITSTEKGWEIDDETLEMGVISLKSSTLDVKELIRQLLVESEEMRPLCSEDCKGLCPVCGANLNKSQCNCDNEFLDPRWTKLKNIKIDK